MLAQPGQARAGGRGMNVSRTLVFLWTPWTIVLGVIAIAVVSGFAVATWLRCGRSRSVACLEALRVLLTIAAVLLLNQPEWVEEYRPEERPAIAVLVDDSASMDTRDVVSAGKPSASAATRREAVAAARQDNTWAELRKRMNVVVQSIASPSSGHGTDLASPLGQAIDRTPNLRGVVLVSDGDWNEGTPPVQTAARLRLKGVPLMAVPVGSRVQLPNLELLSLDLPTFGVAGKSVRVPFTIASSLPRDLTTIVTLKSSDGDEVTREVRIAAMGRTSDAVVWRPRTTGDFTVSLEVPRSSEETIPDDNKLSAPISIREEKLRVLVIESYPRWEYRYLRNALSRDPGVDVSCLLFHPGLSKVGGGNKDYIKQFPGGLDELSKYDVVFLGDVGLEDGQLTAEQCRLLKGLVEHQASGLVFMPGVQGREFSLLETELADLMPVALDPTQPGGWGSRTPNHFELTELGRRSLLTKLADTQDDNTEVWENLPGFQWYAPVLRAKPGADVLAVHKDASNEDGRIPLLATRTFGAGKVLFMGTDGAWRWRKGVEDKYHYRFWGQVVRWMAYQRNMAKGESMRLYYTPDQPKMNQTLALRANVMERSGEPLHRGDVSARITTPTGKTELVHLQATGEEWGEFSGQYTANEAGSCKVVLVCKETGARLETSFFVQGAAAEPVGRPARPEVLEELARVTNGKVFDVDKIDQVARLLSELPEPSPLTRRIPLWCHPAVAAAIITLLGVFWVGRKVVGLV